MTEAEAANRLMRLAREIARHDKLYHDQDAPEISDADYDALVRENRALEEQFPHLIRKDSPSRRLGAAPTSSLAKVTHARPMLSLENAFAAEEVAEFAARIRRFLSLPADAEVALTDGEWVFTVDRRWRGDVASIPRPGVPLFEEDYAPVSDGSTYATRVSSAGQAIAIGDMPLRGARSAVTTEGQLSYELTQGAFAGGRFLVWAGESGLQGELTLYGSGVPIASSERGALIRKP